MRLRSLLPVCLSLLLFCSDLTLGREKSGFERQHSFQRYDQSLLSAVERRYPDKSFVYDRLAQIYCESAFNPLATSDFGGWKKDGLDTVTAIRSAKGAAGLCQFIWPTAQRYGAVSVSTIAANGFTCSADIYNPFWSIDAMCRYMRGIDQYLLTTKSSIARQRLVADRTFRELCATASYNTGEGRIRNRLDHYGGDWMGIASSILPEPRLYAEKIQRIGAQMRTDPAFKHLVN